MARSTTRPPAQRRAKAAAKVAAKTSMKVSTKGSAKSALPQSRKAAAPPGAPAPSAPIEVELKLAVPRAALPLLRRRLAKLGPARRERLETTYFDTADGLLARQGIALRLRRAGARWLQTVKSGGSVGAFSARGEWETVAPGGRLQLARLVDSPLPALLAQHGDPVLQPVFTTAFMRSARVVSVGRARVEVALDEGEVRAGGRSMPLLELELELKAGTPRALFELAERLAAPAGGVALALLPFAESKAARGQRLALDGRPVPVKANAKAFAAALSPADRAADALRHVMGRGIELVLANTQGLSAHPAVSDATDADADDAADVEYVHQARVALRRMRSALRLWRRHGACPAALGEELKWIAAELGHARDADVLVTETLPLLTKQASGTLLAAHRKALAQLTAQAAQARRAADAALRSALASERFAALARAVLAFSALPPAKGAERGPRLRKRAARQLGRAHERLFEAARFFAALSPERRHAVRILAKRLRYALDLFAVALPGPATEAYSDTLADLQEHLGHLNDAHVAAEALAALGAPTSLQAALTAHLAAREAPLLAQAEAALDRLADLPRPWAD